VPPPQRRSAARTERDPAKDKIQKLDPPPFPLRGRHTCGNQIGSFSARCAQVMRLRLLGLEVGFSGWRGSSTGHDTDVCINNYDGSW
jgi:hypothetical protein